MRAIDVNLPLAGTANRRRPWTVLMAVLAAVGVLIAAVQGASALSRRAEAAQLRNRLSASAAPALAAPLRSPVAEAPYHADAVRLAAAAAFEIGQALADLEAVRETGVRLRSVEVNAAEATVSAQFELQDAAAIGAIMESLKANAAALQWSLQEFEAPRPSQPGLLRVRGGPGGAASGRK